MKWPKLRRTPAPHSVHTGIRERLEKELNDCAHNILSYTKEEERARYSKMLYIEQQKRATAMLAEVAKAIAREQAADRALSPKKGEPIE